MGPGTCAPRPRGSLTTKTALFVGLAVACLVLPQAANAAGISVDASVQTHQSPASTTISAGPLTTTSGNDLIVAFISSDGPNRSTGQSIPGVTGGGLNWKLRQRTNGQPGTAEIWEAVAPQPLSGATITATRATGSYGGSIDVVAFTGADTTTDGAVGGGSASTGGPTASLTTTGAGSWVWGVGNDWDKAAARTVGSGQTKVDEFLASSGDTYWVQSQTAPGGSAGATVTLNDTAPATDKWNLSTIEIRVGIPDTQKPSRPTGLHATATNSSQVSLLWTASNDNVGVTGYTVLRDGTAIGNATGTTYNDNTVLPSTSYSYTVEAFDAAGNLSDASDPSSVTTPAASTSPPVISNIATSNVTQTSATISWTTDIPSSSQVLYGTSSAYDHSTVLSNAQVTAHAQTISGLTANTTYHFAVQSTGSTNNTATSTDRQVQTLANNVTLPDMQIQVPTNQMSIGTSGGHRQLQFTHITWDAGTGPFEIDPTYNSSTGMATFSQAIYSSTSPGVWTLDHKVPLPVNVAFSPPDDYQFPLTRFTLNTGQPDGSLGPVVATSPKNDYCITGDARVGGVPNTPNSTFIPSSQCSDPTKPLGWSVGWGDQYDQTDAGQPIDLTNVPDGTYILHATVDPNHVLTESDRTDNVTDTKLQIQGSTVTVLSQTQPTTPPPPTISMSSPTDGSTVSGTVPLSADASAPAGATVSSVQFLLDGLPLGSPVTSAPYNFPWTIGSTSNGNHTLSARVTDSNGNNATATLITVNVQQNNPPPPPDTTPPTVSITNPTQNEIVSGTMPVAANASDNVAVASVQFFLDGNTLGSPVTSAPYAINWDTTAAASGSHTLTAKATDTSGNVGNAAPVTVDVANPAPPMTCFVMQAHVTAHGMGNVTTPSFATAMGGETLIAFVSADGPRSSAQTATVSGAGLTWTLVKRANAQAGDSEVWVATAPNILTNATVASTEAKTGYAQSLNVIAMEGVKGAGAAVAGSGATGAPSVNLTTTAATSLVFGVGNDWDGAVGRGLPGGWVMLDQWINTSAGDTYWTQYTNTPTGAAGSVVNVSDTAPTNHRWNLVAVELLNDGG